LILAGDIGGTKTEMALFRLEGESLGLVIEETFLSGKYSSLEAIMKEFLGKNSVSVDHASFGVAGPVVHGRASLTNLPWAIDERTLKETFKFSSVRILNDLEATAYAVPLLKPSDLRTLNKGDPIDGGTFAVIAPGTGLGEAFLTWDGSRYWAHPSEGGHTDFAPGNDEEMELLKYVQNQSDHVSYEKVCSGQGIRNIYKYYHRDLHVEDVKSWLTQEARQVDETEDPTPVIVHSALERSPRCGACFDTLNMFVSILGSEAGNLALKVLATGGVYLGGGIPPRVLRALENDRFTQAFKRKGRMAQLVSQIPVHVILNPKTALLGAASCCVEARKGIKVNDS
jgi:glucokinase